MASFFSRNPAKNRESSCLKTFYLEGKSPWGFRIVLDSDNQLVISKVRSKSKADLAGLKENYIILLINDLCTQKLTLSQASELIESAQNMCLFVLTNSNQESLNKNYQPEEMVVNEMMGARGHHRILDANPAFGKFQSPANKDSLLLKETEPRRTNYTSRSSNHRARNLNRNYYSAAESNGEEEYETRGKKFNSKSNYMHNSRNDDEKKVSYATITLRQPLKDSNYFSDTEAFHNPNKLRIRNSSNSMRFQKNTATNRSLQQQQQQQLQQGKQQQHQFMRSNSLNSYNSNANANIYNNDNNNHIETDNKANNLNYNIENHICIDSSSQVPRSSVSSIRGMFDQAHANNFNREAHGFSKLNNFYGTRSVVQSPPPRPQFANPTAHVWSPPPVHQAPIRVKNEPYEDPIEAKYEREMGSELAKPTSKANYSDSYFYSSSVHNYPTIEDQKKLAKSIAETLEGSNPETSKYHLKKQKFQKQSSRDGYDSEGPQSVPYYPNSGHEFFPSHEEPRPANDFIYDETLPDVIKRSIAQASLNDPVRLVVAPDSFKSQHYTEHTTHTQMPPRAAMSLAAALESSQSKGGRGAQIFQRRKEKSEKWIVDETNVKRVIGQPPLPKPQPQIYQPQDIIEPRPILNDHKLEQFNNQQNSKFTDFNSKPRGWGNNPIDSNIMHPVNMAIENLSHEINKESQHVPIGHHPNKIDVSGWNNMKNQPHTQHQNYTISKDGIMNLKAKFFDSAKLNEQKPFDLIGHHQPLKKITSHDQYLFSNKSSPNVLKVSLGSNSKSSESPSSNIYSSGYMSDSNNMTGYINSQHDDDIAASDL